MPIARATPLFLILAACVEHAPADASRVTIAAWNAERVFDAVCDSGRCGPSEAEDLPDASAAQADAVRVGRAVRALDADIVVISEIENEAVAHRIADAAATYETVHIGESGPGTIDVAVLSRFAVLEWRTHRPYLGLDDPEVRSTRVFIEVHLDAGARRVIVIGAHFKSRLRDDPSRRLAEARAVAELARAAAARHPGAVVLLAGDLNDTPDSPPLDALEVDAALVLHTRALAPSDAFTFGTGSRRTLIDHVLSVPAPFVETTDVKVVRTDGVAYGGSDHAAVYVAFVVR